MSTIRSEGWLLLATASSDRLFGRHTLLRIPPYSQAKTYLVVPVADLNRFLHFRHLALHETDDFHKWASLHLDSPRAKFSLMGRANSMCSLPLHREQQLGIPPVSHRWQAMSRSVSTLPYYLNGTSNNVCQVHASLRYRPEPFRTHNLGSLPTIHSRFNTPSQSKTYLASECARV